jgi:hypothetical protein
VLSVRSKLLSAANAAVAAKAMMAEVAMALTFMGFLLINSYSYGLDDAHSTMDLYAPLVN